MKIPNNFIEKYSKLVDDKEEFLSILLKPLPKTFRVNTLKSSIEEVKSRFESYGIKILQLPYYKEAFISGIPNIGETLEHFIGYIYSQEITSMLPALAIKEELRKASFVLDACAAPGSKTTQLAALMKNKGLIIANDQDYIRLKALKFNLERIGVLNTTITNKNLLFFPELKFDVVLLDAPCSNEGTTRKNPEIFSTWSENYSKNLSHLQKKLILKAYDLLSENGAMIYSTCAFAPEENEEVIDFLLDKTSAKLEKIELPGIKTMPGITRWNNLEFNSELDKSIRILPHHNDTGGFFIAKIKK